MATISDIAKLAGVSRATVSYVLNDSRGTRKETKEKVLQAIEHLNYRPNTIAKSLKLQRTNTIGIIVEDITIFNIPEIFDGVNEYAMNHGYSTILTNLRLSRLGIDLSSISNYKDIVLQSIEELLGKQVDGIIYIGVHSRDLTGLVGDIGKPIVYTYCYTTIEEEQSVIFDDHYATYEATNYLINNGHRKIGVISGSVDSIPSHGRLMGYQMALMENKLFFNPQYIKIGDWGTNSGYSLAKELLQLQDPPTAILAMNDLMAVGAIKVCKELNISVPNELSIMGFDNREFSIFCIPELTTMKLPLHEMGEQSMEIMIEMINNPDKVKKREKLKCELIVRDSVSPI